MTQGIFGSWDNPHIVYLSSNLGGLPVEIIDRLSRRGWTISHFSNDVQDAFGAIMIGEGSILLIEDSDELPASHVLRTQLSNPIVLLTPTIVACSEHQIERALIKEMGSPEIINSPLSPMKFIEALEWLIRRWKTGHFPKVLAVKNLLMEQKASEAIKLLTHLINTKDLLPIIAPCAAKFIRHQSDAKVVEKILLNAIREYPRNMGMILATIDFYLHAAMPGTALKIVAAARKNHGNPSLIIPEQIQALVMLNEIDQCIPLLKDLIAAKYIPSTAQDFLIRCLYAEGYSTEFLTCINHEQSLLDQFRLAWNRKSGEGA